MRELSWGCKSLFSLFRFHFPINNTGLKQQISQMKFCKCEKLELEELTVEHLMS